MPEAVTVIVTDRALGPFASNAEIEAAVLNKAVNTIGLAHGIKNYKFLLSGGTTARSNVERHQIDAKDFGAVGDWDGTTGTDNAAALNAFFQYIRTLVSTATTPEKSTPIIAKIPPGRYKVEDTINATDIDSETLAIDCAGVDIVGHCSGKPVLEMLGSRWTIFRTPPLIWGDEANTPSYGIRIGKISSNHVGEMSIYDSRIDGYFTRACAYIGMAETNLVLHPQWFNRHDHPDSYVWILDAANWENITSEFVTQTIVQGTAHSTLQNIFHCADFRKITGGPCGLIMGNCNQLEFHGSYMTSANDYLIKTHRSNLLRNVILDLHGEVAAGALGLIQFDTTNPTANVICSGWKIRDHIANYTTCVINTTGITRTLIIDDLDMYIGAQNAAAIPIVGLGSGGDVNKVQVSGRIGWFGAAVDLSNMIFNGKMITRDSVSTAITHTLGSYEVVRRGSTVDDRFRRVKGGLRVAGQPGVANDDGYVELQGGVSPTITVGGDAEIIHARLIPKGATGRVIFGAADADHLYLTGGANPGVHVTGPTADNHLRLVPAGTGVVMFGEFLALAGETLAGYITIRDAAGTLRKIAVVA